MHVGQTLIQASHVLKSHLPNCQGGEINHLCVNEGVDQPQVTQKAKKSVSFTIH